ncbi:hypothetical protein PAP18089_01631 [Pandoraea apista]|uniref:Uncharacterized protein n=1 Tax=Pandoraea apista TaxID=93218 RepID=A0A5E5P2L9_9BURK|nr:sensor histidine kinase [Pandoraea apista]VVG70667.1 hypothetical protein PAP18089_01631 [Pandoraea apista]
MNLTSIGEVANWVTTLDDFVGKDQVQCPDFLRPFHLATLAMTCRKHGIQLGMTADTDDDEKGMRALVSYATRMGLWDAIEQPRPVQINDQPPAGRFHPVALLRDESTVEDTSSKIFEILGAQVRADKQSVNSLEIMAQEIIGNCYAHSEARGQNYGAVCAQTWPKAQLAQVVMCDAGIGIRASLMEREDYRQELTHRNSCEFATGYEVTSKPGRGHSGYGLTVAKQLMLQNGGAFLLVSGDEYYACIRGREDSGKIPVALDGTLVIFEWNTEVPLDIRAVYDSWPTPEGEDDDFLI